MKIYYTYKTNDGTTMFRCSDNWHSAIEFNHYYKYPVVPYSCLKRLLPVYPDYQVVKLSDLLEKMKSDKK